MAYQISVENLFFSYDKDVVLENLNFTVYAKDFLAIIGPNGGGKSTLIKLILDILPTKHITLKRGTSIGYVPQNTNINTNFPITVNEVVMMGQERTKRKLFGYTEEEKACALSALDRVGMRDEINTKIGELSGGQRQRVMIARAICSTPDILILDEPTSSIDAEGQKQIYDLLKRLNKEITIIVVSHDLAITLEYASKVAYINKKLSFHDMTTTSKLIPADGHFCEVELLQMLGSQVGGHL